MEHIQLLWVPDKIKEVKSNFVETQDLASEEQGKVNHPWRRRKWGLSKVAHQKQKCSKDCFCLKVETKEQVFATEDSWHKP